MRALQRVMRMIFGALFSLALLVGGIAWCKEVFERLGNDIADLKEAKDPFRPAAILLVWLVTGAIMYLIVGFLYGLVGNVIEFLH